MIVQQIVFLFPRLGICIAIQIHKPSVIISFTMKEPLLYNLLYTIIWEVKGLVII